MMAVLANQIFICIRISIAKSFKSTALYDIDIIYNEKEYLGTKGNILLRLNRGGLDNLTVVPLEISYLIVGYVSTLILKIGL